MSDGRVMNALGKSQKKGVCTSLRYCYLSGRAEENRE
jgi:hypothetical protein